MQRWLAIFGVALGLSFVGYAVLARETDEERIRATLANLEKAVRIDGDTATNPLFRAGQLRRDFKDIFDEGVSYRIPDLSTPAQGSQSLVRLATQSSISLTTLDITFSHVTIRILPSSTGATADAVATIRAFHGSEPYEQGDRTVHFQFSKATGDFRIDSFSVEPRDH